MKLQRGGEKSKSERWRLVQFGGGGAVLILFYPKQAKPKQLPEATEVTSALCHSALNNELKNM